MDIKKNAFFLPFVGQGLNQFAAHEEGMNFPKHNASIYLFIYFNII